MHLPIRAHLLASLFLVCAALAPAARAAVVLQFSEENGSTRVNISGSLDTSGLSFGSALSFSSLNLKEGELWFTGGSGSYRFASHSLPVTTWHALNSNGFAYSDVSGADFGFNPLSIAVPASYSSGAPLSTSFLIDGLALATLNPQPGVVMTLNNGDTISISVIPEPAAATTFAAGVAAFAVVFHRRRPRATA